MKAVILAAGQGSRLNKYTQYLPKGMLRLKNKPILQWQVDSFRKQGINDIAIVTGYMAEKIQIRDVLFYHNSDFQTTNMVESLMCIDKDYFTSDIIISYSDILFSENLLKKVLSSRDEVVIAADLNWRNYWHRRYGTTETDLESFSVNAFGYITDIGKAVETSEQLKHRYIGLNKFSYKAIHKGIDLYNKKRDEQSEWYPSGKKFRQGYFTDFIQMLIDNDVKAKAAETHGDWLEFDTAVDYEMICELESAESLHQLIQL